MAVGIDRMGVIGRQETGGEKKSRERRKHLGILRLLTQHLHSKTLTIMLSGKMSHC